MERIANCRFRFALAVLTSLLIGCGDDYDTRVPWSADTTNAGHSSLDTVANKAVTLALTPPTETVDGTPLWTGLAGYRIYWGTSLGQYPHSETIANPGVATYVIDNLAAGTWFFVATVITTDGVESDFSDPISVAL